MSTIRRRTTRVLISGVDTPHREIQVDFDVDQPIATGSVTISAPRPAHVEIGAWVTVLAGYDGNTQVIFSGRIPEDVSAFNESGSEVRCELEGWGVYLNAYRAEDTTLPGATPLHDMFYAYCHEAGVPSYWSDLTFAPDGDLVRFGGVPDIDGGLIVVDADTSLLSDLSRRARLYGYRHYDTPSGVHRMTRVNGLPSADPVRAYTEPTMKSVDKSRSMRGMANYIEVLGARYTQASPAEEVAIRSIPLAVTADPRFGATGVNKVTINDPDIVTQDRADDVRNVHEIDLGYDQLRWRWTIDGDPDLEPGTVVSVTSPTVAGYSAAGTVGEIIRNLPVNMWLMRVSHSITSSGWTTTLEGWFGGGQALPAGDDCVTQTLLGPEGRHVGNEWLSHYRRPNPDGLEVEIPFTVADDYSTLTIRGIAHGANSFVGNTESTASRFEIWQTWYQPDRAMASGEFPRQDENLERRYPYGPTDTYWSPISIPLSGSLKAGAATLKIISGNDSSVGDYDDYECANITLTTCGVGTPIVMS